jgi:hypothetical protein
MNWTWRGLVDATLLHSVTSTCEHDGRHGVQQAVLIDVLLAKVA